MSDLLSAYSQSLAAGGYAAVMLLMALESSIVPIPSEIIIPPAAYLAVTQQGMSLPLLVLAGTVGSWLGAAVMYAVSRYVGRGWLLRFGRLVGITDHKVYVMDAWVAKTGSTAVLIARLLPVVRHLIGIPMGLARLSFWRYSLMTVIGSGIWCTVLAWVGVAAGHDPLVVAGDVHRLSLWFLLGGVAVLTLYVIFVRRHFTVASEVTSSGTPDA